MRTSREMDENEETIVITKWPFNVGDLSPRLDFSHELNLLCFPRRSIAFHNRKRSLSIVFIFIQVYTLAINAPASDKRRKVHGIVHSADEKVMAIWFGGYPSTGSVVIR